MTNEQFAKLRLGAVGVYEGTDEEPEQWGCTICHRFAEAIGNIAHTEECPITAVERMNESMQKIATMIDRHHSRVALCSDNAKNALHAQLTLSRIKGLLS